MKSLILLLLLLPAMTIAQEKLIQPAYKIANTRTKGANKNYDVYVADVNKISEVNKYLSGKLDNDHLEFFEVNYFDDPEVAKTYFAKQTSDKTSDREKEKLYKNYIACFKHNHLNGFQSLSFLHGYFLRVDKSAQPENLSK
jgi:hypothetical protein